MKFEIGQKVVINPVYRESKRIATVMDFNNDGSFVITTDGIFHESDLIDIRAAKKIGW